MHSSLYDPDGMYARCHPLVHTHAHPHHAHALLRTQAAAIPLPLVRSMLGPYLVFLCSTVNGYEGTGRSLRRVAARVRHVAGVHGSVCRAGWIAQLLLCGPAALVT